jgi:hypothetical protein
MTKLIKSMMILLVVLSCSSKESNSKLSQVPTSINLSEFKEEGVLEIKKQIFEPDENGVINRVELKLPDYQNALYYRPFSYTKASGNRVEPIWFSNLNDLKTYAPQKPREDNNLKLGLFLLIQKTDGKYLAILPIVSSRLGNSLDIDNGKLYLEFATYGTEKVNQNAPLMAYAESANPYEAARVVWEQALKCENVKGNVKFRSQKKYPEPYKYLGWCSWEHYRSKINEQIIVNSVNDIKKSPIPIRWVLVDDGYLDQKNRQLLSFGVDKKKFPNGWKNITCLKDDKLKWFGIWRNFNGYMSGVNQNHSMQNLSSDIRKVKDGKNPIFMSKTNKESANNFYNQMTVDTKNNGFDMIKVDFQTVNMVYNKGTENPVQGVHFNNQALENNCKNKDLHLLNCIAMQNFNVFNHSHSNLIRSSVDYKINFNRTDLCLVQNLYNPLWLGHIHWMDHDMFHTSYKETARINAVTRAMSGAPVYLSDETKNMDDEVLKPLMYSNGKIVGTLAPLSVLPKSLMHDPYKGKKAISIISPLKNKSCAIVSLNLNRGEVVNETLSPEDYKFASSLIQPYKGQWKIPSEGLLIFDSYNRTASRFINQISFKLKTREERLFQLFPIKHNYALLGMDNKYLSGMTYDVISQTKEQIKFKLVENGDILFWSDHKAPKSENFKFTEISKGLYKGKLIKENKGRVYIINWK